MSSSVPEFYGRYEPQVKQDLLALRGLVLETAEQTDGVGIVEETLKWGQPSFVTVRPKSGSTIRIDEVGDSSGAYAAYFICHTHLVERFRELYPETFNFQGDRTLLFQSGEALPIEELKHCFAMALTYHQKPKG